MLELHKTIRISHLVACTIVFFTFMGEVGRKKCSVMKMIIFFSIVSRLGLFLQIFG